MTKICRSSTQTGQAYKVCPNGIQWYSASITAVGCGATEAEAYERATRNAIAAAQTKASKFADKDECMPTSEP